MGDNIPEFEVVELENNNINKSKTFLFTGIGLIVIGVIIALIPSAFLKTVIVLAGLFLGLLSLWSMIFIIAKKVFFDYIVIFILAVLGFLLGASFCIFPTFVLKIAIWIISFYLLAKGLTEIIFWARLKAYKPAIGFIFNGILSILIAISVWIVVAVDKEFFNKLIGIYIAFSFLTTGVLIVFSIVLNRLKDR